MSANDDDRAASSDLQQHQASSRTNDGAFVGGDAVISAPARSIFDSRTLESDAGETPRYLTHSSSNGNGNTNTNQSNSSNALSFSEAFAAIRNTESYTKPKPPAPPIVPASATRIPPASTKDAATLVFVNRCQTGNPLLKAVKNVSLEFKDGLVPDYVMEGSCCVLFVSVRYHLLHTGYLEERIDRIRKEDPTPYRSKVVLCFVDVDDNEIALREINRVALLSQFTLILAWSWIEAARYIETLKAYENKSATLIKEKVEAEFLPKANDVLTSIRSVNKTDVVTLLSTFGTVQGLMNASMEELSLCPGVGAKKVRLLLETFQEPFTRK